VRSELLPDGSTIGSNNQASLNDRSLSNIAHANTSALGLKIRHAFAKQVPVP